MKNESRSFLAVDEDKWLLLWWEVMTRKQLRGEKVEIRGRLGDGVRRGSDGDVCVERNEYGEAIPVCSRHFGTFKGVCYEFVICFIHDQGSHITLQRDPYLIQVVQCFITPMSISSSIPRCISTGSSDASS
ncbi:hypothetical protein Tco_0686439 [Tanacetum coccineum]